MAGNSVTSLGIWLFLKFLFAFPFFSPVYISWFCQLSQKSLTKKCEILVVLTYHDRISCEVKTKHAVTCCAKTCKPRCAYPSRFHKWCRVKTNMLERLYVYPFSTSLHLMICNLCQKSVQIRANSVVPTQHELISGVKKWHPAKLLHKNYSLKVVCLVR